MSEPEMTIGSAAGRLAELKQMIGRAVVGQDAVVEEVLLALIAAGHVLIEGVPGLGKTLLVRALAQALALPHARIQLTPDMLPSDITGHAVL
ncbi:MAG TPA: MoxR family ATPase, partial [Vicinamibacterales bacterium]|nr:MoxR family ATPase [Vicinamibacterales bacterium]